jgi:hypothetical protein
MRSHLIIPALVASLAVGCGSDDDPDDAARTTSPTAPREPSAPEQLLGTYARDVTRADIERTAERRSEAGPNQETPPPGPARLVIAKATMRFEGIDPAGGPPVTIDQDFTATGGGRLTIEGYRHPEVGSFCGPEIPQNASYRWRTTGGALRLEAVRDRCADRDSLLAGEWRREG